MSVRDTNTDRWALPRAAGARLRALGPRRSDWTTMGQQPGRDVLAGLTVAVVALPLALAFGITSGLGASAGLISAIVAGIVAGVFGGSNLQISGPTGAMTVVLVPIAMRLGASGVLAVGLIAGLVLIGLAWSGAARVMRYVPLPVVEGFTAGIAMVIALQQVPAALGFPVHGKSPLVGAVTSFQHWLAAPGTPGLEAPVIALGVMAAMLVLGRRWPRLPVSLGAVIVATLATTLLNLHVATIGALPSILTVPSVPHVASSQLASLLGPALAIAALAALESLLSASVADAMTVDERHDPDRELFGQGMANLITPLFGGVPATAAIARTAVNVRAGGRSRLAPIVQSVALLVVAIAGSSLVATIPLAALAGVLFATTIRMVEVSSVRSLLRASRSDGIVLFATAGATVVLNLVTAVLIGLVVAAVFAIRGIAQTAAVEEISIERPGQTDAERALLAQHVVAYRLEGALFFAAAHSFLLQLADLGDVRYVILRMSHLITLDSSGAAVLADTITALEQRGVGVLLSGLQPEHEHLLAELGVLARLRHESHVFATTPEAIDHALGHVTRDALTELPAAA